MFQKRYPTSFSNTLPEGWKPENVILEGMFTISTSPLPTQHKKFYDYGVFLVQKWLLFHISSPDTKEIHVLFDHPGQMEFSPKDVERARHDTTASPTFNISVTFQNSTPIPSGVKLWRELISERHCKGELIKYLANLFLGILPEYLKGHQTFIAAGGFDDPTRKDKALVCSQSMKGSLLVCTGK